MKIARCHACLRPGHEGFCLPCRKSLFRGERVGPMLPFSRPDYNLRKREQTGRLSISGVQSKHSLKLNGSALELTEKGGEYILKPVMTGEFENLGAMPANEHATMQLARQVFHLNTALCAIVFFKDDGTPAYLTKRFDVLPDGSRVQQEDFAQIADVSEETQGKNYKYGFSYERIAALMKRHVSAYAVEVEIFFKLVVFNYLVHNGDAHLKNFSLYRGPAMDAYVMTPAYDLLNTRLHLPGESAMALDLFDADYETESYKRNGFYMNADFYEFGVRLGIPVRRVTRFLEEMTGCEEAVVSIVNSSFLPDALKKVYLELIAGRMDAVRPAGLGNRKEDGGRP